MLENAGVSGMFVPSLRLNDSEESDASVFKVGAAVVGLNDGLYVGLLVSPGLVGAKVGA